MEVFAKAGLQMQIPATMENVEWFGMGPHATYPDRQASGKIAKYSMSVDELWHDFVKPQENANRGNVRWLAVTDDGGDGLFFQGNDLLNFSAYPYADDDIFHAQHINELEKRECLTLNIDYLQNGLGTATCGPGYLDRYIVKARYIEFSIRMKIFNAKCETPEMLKKQRFPQYTTRYLSPPILETSRNIFNAPMKMTMKSPNQDIEIRYTTDWTSPTVE